LISTMGAFATDANNFGFTITKNTAGTGITITATGTNVFRLDGGADGVNFSLPQYVPKPRNPSTDNNYAAVFAAANSGATQATTRAQWVNYLNALGTAVAPQASIAEVAGSSNVNFAKTLQTAVQVYKGQEVTLKANTPVATGAVTYSWYCSDNGAAIAPAATATRTFTQLGTFLCSLTATTTSGVTRENIYVKVVPPYVAPEDQPVIWDNSAEELNVKNLPAHTKITVSWGDLTPKTTVNNAGTGVYAVPHTFAKAGTYSVVVRAFNGETQVKTIGIKVTIP